MLIKTESEECGELHLLRPLSDRRAMSLQGQRRSPWSQQIDVASHRTARVCMWELSLFLRTEEV